MGAASDAAVSSHLRIPSLAPSRTPSYTFASRLAIAGVGIRAIQELLGHKSLAMTVRYSHLSPDFLQKAVHMLVPPQPEDGTQDRTDTRTDTDALASVQPPTASVH